MTKFKTLINFKDNTIMYARDHKKAFENAKLKGLNDPENYMYMYSKQISFVLFPSSGSIEQRRSWISSGKMHVHCV